MPLDLKKPILYLITGGTTTESTAPDSEEFREVVELVTAAVAAGIQLIQLREKELSPRCLFELVARAAEITGGSSTCLLVNDRADIAAAAGADGVHLTTRSLKPKTIRAAFGEKFLIGVSAHSLAETEGARDGGADFAVLGPVFDTASKGRYGPPLGITRLGEIANALTPFPILALGGVSPENAAECVRAGAGGVAGIGMFSNVSTLRDTVSAISRIEQPKEPVR